MKCLSCQGLNQPEENCAICHGTGEVPDPMALAAVIMPLEQPTQAVAVSTISERLLYHAEQIDKLRDDMEKQSITEHLYEVRSVSRNLRSLAGQFLSLK